MSSIETFHSNASAIYTISPFWPSYTLCTCTFLSVIILCTGTTYLSIGKELGFFSFTINTFLIS